MQHHWQEQHLETMEAATASIEAATALPDLLVAATTLVFGWHHTSDIICLVMSAKLDL